jgi:hypothetical protein
MLLLGSIFIANRARADDAAPPPLGMSPQAAQVSAQVANLQAPQIEANLSSDFQIQYHGFFRAPLVLGFGTRPDAMPGQSGIQVHSPPMVPDANYVNWAFTNNLGGPWAQLNFSAGNAKVSGTVILAAYNLTDAGWTNLTAQLGITQAFLTVNLPHLLPRLRLLANIGAFSNGYGAAGKYDAGFYNTFLIGRTHVAGETVTLSIKASDAWAIQLEEGFGAKLDVIPYVAPMQQSPLLPYPGPTAQGSTLLAHAHAGVSYQQKLLLGVHWLYTFTQDGRATPTQPDGHIQVLGADIKLNGGVLGDGYVGFSNVQASHSLPVADSLELLHSIGGWELRDNFFGPNSDGTGSIWSVLFQYTFSLATALRHPNPFWGQGPDLLLSVFGMANLVSSTDPQFDGTTKFKLGVEATYLPLKWLGVSSRFDMVEPTLADNTQSFYVLSPKLLLRTDFLTHEQIILGYTRYFYGSSVTPTYPNQALRPDKNVVQLSALLWW